MQVPAVGFSPTSATSMIIQPALHGSIRHPRDIFATLRPAALDLGLLFERLPLCQALLLYAGLATGRFDKLLKWGVSCPVQLGFASLGEAS